MLKAIYIFQNRGRPKYCARGVQWFFIAHLLPLRCREKQRWTLNLEGWQPGTIAGGVHKIYRNCDDSNCHPLQCQSASRDIIEPSSGPRHLSTIPLINSHLFKIAESVISFCLKKIFNSAILNMWKSFQWNGGPHHLSTMRTLLFFMPLGE